MSKLLIQNAARLSGVVAAPPSKSEAVRGAILYSLCKVKPDALLQYQRSGNAGAGGDMPANDIVNSVNACNTAFFGEGPPNVGESAALLRMLIPVLLAKYGIADIIASVKAARRGIDEYADCFGVTPKMQAMGGNVRIVIKKRLKAGEYDISCKRSSQFLSGLIMALPLLDGESRIHIMGEECSAPYVQMTVEMARRFGALVEKRERGYSVAKSAYSVPPDFSIGGDWSYAANYAVANRLGGNAKVEGLDAKSLQADAQINSLLDRLYGGEDAISVFQCPDLFCPLVIAACGRRGVTVLWDTARLSYKESDRPLAMARLVTRLGGKMTVNGDSVTVYGTGGLMGGDCDSCSDHRVAMAAAIAAGICETPVALSDWECVKKSAPRFFDDYRALGGIAYELNG